MGRRQEHGAYSGQCQHQDSNYRKNKPKPENPVKISENPMKDFTYGQKAQYHVKGFVDPVELEIERVMLIKERASSFADDREDGVRRKEREALVHLSSKQKDAQTYLEHCAQDTQISSSD